MPRQRRLAHVIVLPLRCHTLQSFPHPYSRIHVTADRCPPAVAGCVLFPGPARLQGVAPYERPLRPPPLPVTYARCSLGLPVLGASRPSSLSPSRPKPDGARCRPLGGDRVSQEEAGPSTCGAPPKKQTAPDRRPQPCKGAGLPASRTAGDRRPRPTRGRYGRPTDTHIHPLRPHRWVAPWLPRTRCGVRVAADRTTSPWSGGLFMLDIASMPARATKTTASRPEGRSGNPREVKATGVRLRGLATRGHRLRPFPRMSQAFARQRGPTVRGAGCCPPDVFVFVPELRPGRSQRVSPR